MSTSDQIRELEALTEGLRAVAAAEEAAADAKRAYREDPSEQTRAAHREASQALNDARAQVRGNDTARAVVPGDVVMTPQTVGS